jgi:hypothetical protein
MLFNQQQCFIYSTASFLSKLRAKKVEKLHNLSFYRKFRKWNIGFRNRERLFPVLPIIIKKKKKKKKINPNRPTLDFLTCDSKHTYIFFGPCNLYRKPSIDASYLVSVHLAERFQKRRLFRNLRPSNLQLMPWIFQIQYSYLLNIVANISSVVFYNCIYCFPANFQLYNFVYILFNSRYYMIKSKKGL